MTARAPGAHAANGGGYAVAAAHPNIALAKYWGKRGFGHNLPAVPSLSVTLAGMRTTTAVTFDPGLAADELVLASVSADARRASELLDRVRAAARIETRARVVSDNDFPTSAGLASSASAFAALALAASAAAGLPTDAARISDLARKTSVSAARSAFGGFAALRAGEEGDVTLAAEPVAEAAHWAIRVVVAVTTERPKDVGSTVGMRHTAESSPYFAAWVDDAPRVFARVKAAVLARDLEALGVAAEESALRMHACAMAASPGVVYWSGATVEAMAAVRRLRAGGVPAWFTIDAGPHLKVITEAARAAEVSRALRESPGVLRTIVAEPGPGAHLVGDPR
jgi:diphosphomevalonate decarboxylase